MIVIAIILVVLPCPLVVHDWGATGQAVAGCPLVDPPWVCCNEIRREHSGEQICRVWSLCVKIHNVAFGCAETQESAIVVVRVGFGWAITAAAHRDMGTKRS